MKIKMVMIVFSESFSFKYPKIKNYRELQKLIYKIQSLKSDVYLITLDKQVNFKSILGVMSLRPSINEPVRITCYHNDKSIVHEDIEKIKAIIEGTQW